MHTRSQLPFLVTILLASTLPLTGYAAQSDAFSYVDEFTDSTGVSETQEFIALANS